MRQEEIEVGKEYLTTVGESKARVVVTRRVEPDGRWEKRVRFAVRRAGEARELPKPRHAAALHPLAGRDASQAMRPARPRPEPQQPRAWPSKIRPEDPRCALVLGCVAHHLHGEYSAHVVLSFAPRDLERPCLDGLTELQAQAATLGFVHRAAARHLEAGKLAEEFLGRANAQLGYSTAAQGPGGRWHPWQVANPNKPWIVRRLVSGEQLKQLVRDLGDEGPGWFFRLRAEPCGWAHCRDGGEHHAKQIDGMPHSADQGPIFTVEVYLPSLDRQEELRFGPVTPGEVENKRSEPLQEEKE